MPIDWVVAGGLYAWLVVAVLGVVALKKGFTREYHRLDPINDQGWHEPIVVMSADRFDGSVAQTVVRTTGRFKRAVFRGVAKVVRAAKHRADDAIYYVRRHGQDTIGQVWDIDMSVATNSLSSWVNDLRSAHTYVPRHGA